ncbi:hypothetical protein A9404_06745 [Halothiobacillus diazotrophicus]|uniref:Uncharacterized protein n=1 Tax=Halothiobacillus diazotrophicus TaxID=1860122 RepID=A0A191ZGZ2_9GAMM|nr:hypothetical protein [Halothiobacillus diazotrophicus]ANJ67122.1 hypothetical protein A9404_06745 [Halothiobacillus diazotrophicus]
MARETGPASLALLRAAARLCVEDASLPHVQALRRVAQREGVDLDERFLDVDCTRLETEIRQYQLVFKPEQRDVLRALRAEALQAMDFLAEFSPRLVGAVLSGTADRQSTVTLHLFADAPEDVMTFLMGRNIPFTESDRRYQYRNGRQERVPVLSFLANGVPFDLVVFGHTGIKEAPLGGGRNAPIHRASPSRLRAMLDDVGAPATR